MLACKVMNGHHIVVVIYLTWSLMDDQVWKPGIVPGCKKLTLILLIRRLRHDLREYGLSRYTRNPSQLPYMKILHDTSGLKLCLATLMLLPLHLKGLAPLNLKRWLTCTFLQRN
jgi:hypothetical protein